MGTRNLQIVIKDGAHRVSKYCQWDGYPSGQGICALEFVRDGMDEDRLRANIDKCEFIDDKEINSIYNDFRPSVIKDDSKTFSEVYPQLQRDMGAEIFGWIQNSKANRILLKDDIDFAKDGLFCEYAYVIDLDKRTFEAYTGGRQAPTEGERFASLKPCEHDYGEGGKEVWYPIKCVGTWDFDALPTNAEFYASFNETEEIADG